MRKFITVLIVIVGVVAVLAAIGLMAKPTTHNLAFAAGYGLGESVRFWFITIPVIAGGLFVWMKLRRKAEAKQ